LAKQQIDLLELQFYSSFVLLVAILVTWVEFLPRDPGYVLRLLSESSGFLK